MKTSSQFRRDCSAIMNFIHQELIKDEKLSNDKSVKYANFITAQAKSCAEPANSFIVRLANNTSQACFFIRSIRSPKENVKPSNRLGVLLSMVVRNGKGSPFAVFQSRRFCSPLRTTAQTLQSLAVVLYQFRLELSPMLYLFKAISRRDLRNTSKSIQSFPCYTLRIQADSLKQAKMKVCPLFAVLEVRYA